MGRPTSHLYYEVPRIRRERILAILKAAGRSWPLRSIAEAVPAPDYSTYNDLRLLMAAGSVERVGRGLYQIPLEPEAADVG